MKINDFGPKPIVPIESLETLNARLLDYFGRFETGEANWQLFWSEDMIEKRLCYQTENGVDLLTPEPRVVRKANYIHNRYVLCKLVPIPPVNQVEMLGAKTSYEPLWTFENFITGDAIAPEWGIINAIIKTAQENILNAEHKAPLKHPESMMNTEEAIKDRVDKLMEGMFGNETSLGDSLALDTAVGYGTRKRSDWIH